MKHAKSLSVQLLFLISLVTCSWVQAAPDVIWGSWINGSESATDCNVILSETTINLEDDGGDGVAIRAEFTDVTVTMTCCDVVIRGVGDNPRLYLEPMNGHEIRFCVNNDLAFQGGLGDHPLLIVIRGDGNVVFEVEGGSSVSFLPADDMDAAGVKTFVCMDSPGGVPCTNKIQLCFERKSPDNNPSDLSNVCLGRNCVLTYLAENTPENSDETACITFDPTHAGTGRYVLKIDDQAAVSVRGCKTDDCGKDQLILADIDCTVLAGDNAILNIGPKTALNKTRASSQNANLLVLNNNETWTELLEDPFCNLGAREDNVDYNGDFGGVQYGFIVGANGTLDILDGAFLDYVSLTTTACVDLGDDDPALSDNTIKARNASALIIDGSHDPSSRPAQILIGDCSALYLRSGADRFGTVTPITDEHPFTIDPLFRTPGAGATVMHIEGPLDVCGSNEGVDSPDDLRSAIEVLSLEVYFDVVTNNQPLFVGGTGSGFLERTFATDNLGDYRQYNAANIMVNNCWNLYDTAIKHTDQIHKVLENNDTLSEPTYIGGDSSVLKDEPKERLSFYNSVFLVHTDVAFTGFDLTIPNGLNGPCPPICESLGDCLPNLSRFYFFYNGKVIDQGSGRNMILGTHIGSTACDGCTVICRDAHLDVMQTTECEGGDVLQHELELKTQANDDTINENISGDINGQTSIHTIYLGHNSNISIGTNVSNDCENGQGTDKDGDRFELTTLPKFTIGDNYFSFETRGGSLGLPCTSNVTGQGGVFVDKNGTICLTEGKRVFFGTMITKSCDGVIDIPKECMLFADTVGIADWNLNLAEQQVIVPANQCLSEYTLNWRFITKDYEGGFCPYEVGDCGECNCGPVLDDNVFNLPRVDGIVNQLQIKGSRFGDPAHLSIGEGGIVCELVHLIGGNSAEAPVSVVELRHNSRLGLGSIERNRDSTRTVSRLGTNGVTLIANGDGVVELNEDAIIDGRCAILAGPSFLSGNKITIQSKKGKQLRIGRNAVIDLSSFTLGQRLVFGGDLEVVVEPGARIHLGGDIHNIGATIRFEDRTTMLLEPLPDSCECVTVESCIDIPMANESIIDACISGVCGEYVLRPKHVIASGNGSIQFAHNSALSIPRGSSLSVQSYEPCGIDYTNLSLEALDRGQIQVGNDEASEFGGSLQVGNESDQSGATINFTLKVNGPDARFAIASQGILGLAVGVECKNFEPLSNALTKVLYNVGNINLELGNGTLSHNHIYPTTHEYGSLIVLSDGMGSTASYSITIDPGTEEDSGILTRTTIQGGAPVGYILPTTDTVKVEINTINGVINSILQGGIAKSARHYSGAPGGAFTAQQAFNFLTLGELSDSQPTTGQATCAFSISNNNSLRVGYISGDVIYRATNVRNLIGTAGKLTSIQHSANRGSITIGVNADNSLRYAVENQ